MKFLKISTLILFFIIIAIVITNVWINYSSKNLTYDSIDSIPKNKVGLVLGAGKFTSDGGINLYYKYRVDAAIKLYEAGKIEFLLISGDNGSKDYDEPSNFKNDLIARGIPEDRIILDYAGFRTLDSVIRAKEVFGQNSITFISQKFHNERAIYLAKNNNMKAIGFNAQDITGSYGFKTQIREYLARAKASIDVSFNVQPKFLGEKIAIK